MWTSFLPPFRRLSFPAYYSGKNGKIQAICPDFRNRGKSFFRWKKMWKTVAAGISFSLFIEIIQLITSRGCFDFDDVLLNGLGTVLGFGTFQAAKRLFTKNDLNAAGN